MASPSRNGRRVVTGNTRSRRSRSLKLTLAETHNVSSAISLARERGEGPSSSSRLAATFGTFDEDRANHLLEESLTLRSIERTIEELLLGAVSLRAQEELTSAEYEFGWRHATGWMSALKRISPPATRTDAVLIFDGSAPGSLDALHAQALELVLRRAGVRTLSLTPAIEPNRLGRALRALEPNAVVLTGRAVALDAIGRLVYAVRSVVQQVVVFDYRGAVPDTGASTVTRLGASPTEARDLLLARLDGVAAPVAANTPVAVAVAHR